MQTSGIYIRKNNRDRYGKDGLNYGMTGIFTQQPSMWPVSEPNGPLWTFCPDGGGSFMVFREDFVIPRS